MPISPSFLALQLSRIAVIPDITASPTDRGFGARYVLRVDGGNTSNCRSALRVTDLRQWATERTRLRERALRGGCAAGRSCGVIR
jgi:hypothetical protein